MAEKVKKGRGKIGKRAAALLLAFCVVISLLAVPALAADTPTVSGVWVFHAFAIANINKSLTENISFVCNGKTYSSIVFVRGEYMGYADASGNVTKVVWSDAGDEVWLSSEYKTIDFGSTNQDVSSFFYVILTNSAIQQGAECTHTNTEIRNATDYYTGDTYCSDCDELISSGTYAINGWWLLKENIVAPITAPLVENMAFACCGRNFEGLGWTGTDVGIYYGNVKVYDNITGWINDNYRTVNLGDALISVSKNFAAWFAVNATRYDHCPHFSAVELEAGSGQLYCYSCESIISSAGSCVHSNTYVKKQSTTYSGDTYCLDCGALISTGSALECPHSNTVIRDQTDYYTGDKYCADCGALLEEGEEDPDGALNSEEDKANSGGNSSVDDLTGAIPDYSGEFVAALTSFAAAFSYEGTDAVLTIPAITIPEIAGLIPETEIYAGQQFNFGDYFGLLPATLLLLVQALLTIALIVYCFKELYDMISYALTLRRGGSGGE